MGQSSFLRFGAVAAVCLGVSEARAQSVSVNDPAPTKEGSDVVFTVRLSRATSRIVTMTYLTSDGTAKAGIDYGASSGSLSFAAGEVEKQIRVRTLLTPASSQSGIKFDLRLSSVRNASVADARGVATIINAAVEPVTVSVLDPGVAMEGKPVDFHLVLNKASKDVITVHYATQSGEAESMSKPGQDYQGVNSVDSGSALTFLPGETRKSVVIQTNDDAVVDSLPVERFYLNLLSATGAIIADGRGVGSIQDNDLAPAPAPTPRPTGVVVTPFDGLSPGFFIYVGGTGCSDGNTGSVDAVTAAQTPKCTVQGALNAASPGTAVMIRQGEYFFSSTYRLPKAGSLTAPIWIRSADGIGKARLVRTGDKEPIRTNGKSNLVFEGLHFVGGIALYNATSGSNFSESDPSLQRNIVLRNNVFSQGFEDGIKASFASGVYVLNNTILDTADEQGIDFVAVSDSFIVGNVISGTPSHGIVAKGGSRNVLIENNRVSNMLDSDYAIWAGGSSCENGCLWAEAMAGRYEGKDLIVRGNVVDASIMVMGCQDCAIVKNDVNGAVKLEPSPGPEETPHVPPFVTRGTIVLENF